MQRIITLLIITLSVSCLAQNCNIGNSNSTGFDNSGGLVLANYLTGIKFNLETKGTLQSLNLVGRNTGAKVQMALYNDNDNTPENLIVSTGIKTIDTGFISLPVTPTYLSSGNYWIMAIYDTDAEHTYTTSDSIKTGYFTLLNFGDNLPINASNFSSFKGFDITYFMEVTCETVGLQDYNSSKKYDIYPNPTTDFLNLKSEDNIESVKIFDINGSLLFSKNYNTPNIELDLTHLKNGFYTALINENQRIKITKK